MPPLPASPPSAWALAEARARFDLVLNRSLVDAQRVLSLVRTDRCHVERFELIPPKRCHLWVRGRSVQLLMLRERLERLKGVSVDGEERWTLS